ncbi:MAG: hypothetical protein IKO19_01420 [Candidatus Riflebacteria bacterium]|nr:hypothetical protein [Candidatus Riflebacteria bacterium]
MKITGKLLNIFILYSILAVSANAETIQFGKKRNTKKESNINAAQIKDDEAGVASTSFSNLPKNEVINTFYADPLSDEFMGKDHNIKDSERNRSTKDLLSEFNGQVKVINDNTEIPDEDELVDVHSKDDRARIEARADELLKEAAIQESKNNTGEALLEKNPDKITEKLSDKETKTIASYTDLYTENATESATISDISTSEEKNSETTELSKEQPEEDPEFSNKPVGEEVVIIEEKDSEETIDIPEYEKLEGIVSADEIDEEPSSKRKRKEEEKSAKTAKSTKKDKLLKKMSEPLEPVLLTEGKPKSEDDENEKIYTYSGLLIPEKQLLSRKKYMVRWVLKLDDGTRIPLKSNLKLLQEVKKESNLNDFVTISGKMRTSAMEKDLKYLVPDSVLNGIKLNKSKDSAKNDSDNKGKSDDKQNIEPENKSESESQSEPEAGTEIKNETASETPSLSEVSKLPADKDSLQTTK